MNAPIVFFDIAGLDTTGLRRFYSRVFGWEVDRSRAVRWFGGPDEVRGARVAVLGLFRGPEGNPMGLVEIEARVADL